MGIVERIMDGIKDGIRGIGRLRGASFLPRGVLPARSDTDPNAVDGKGCIKYGDALRASVIPSEIDSRQIKTSKESAYGDCEEARAVDSAADYLSSQSAISVSDVDTQITWERKTEEKASRNSEDERAGNTKYGDER